MRARLVAALALSLAACRKEPPPAPPAPPPAVKMTLSCQPEAADLVRRALVLVDNSRWTEGVPHLRRAIELDPGCAMAYALLGSSSPDAEGIKALDAAVAKSASLPDAEKAYIRSQAAFWHGEIDRACELARQAVDLAPADARVRMHAATLALNRDKLDVAEADLKKAVELEPGSGAAWNLLGYTYLQERKKDEAIAAFRRYVEVAPAEPNARDSLGEALLVANRLEEAEAAFRAAVALKADFHGALTGLAQVRALRGDFAGAYEALATAAGTAPAPREKAEILTSLAWTRMAEGKAAAALEALAQAEQLVPDGASDGSFPFTLAAVHRSRFLNESGRPAEGEAAADEALARAAKLALPRGVMNWLKPAALRNRLDAQLRQGRQEAAVKTLDELAASADRFPFHRSAQCALHDARGLTVLAAGDAKAAVAEFAQCPEDMVLAKLDHHRALLKAGDAAGAAALRQKLVGSPQRVETYLWLRAQLGAPAAEAAAH